MSKELPMKYRRLVDRYKPIEVEGFTLYPYTVEHYEEYLVASQAVGYMQQKLPINLMSIPILSAFFKLDLEKAIVGEVPTGLYTSAIVSIVLALRLAKDGEDILEVCKGFVPITSQSDPTNLKALAFNDAEGQARTITPVQYAVMRPIIAAQNGIDIPDDLDNPELVQAEQDLAEKKAPKLKVQTNDLVLAAADMTGKDEEEIYGWAVLKLARKLAMHRRIMDYQICAISEGNGASWKSGNPVPHPFFERIKEGSDALISMDQFANGQGLRAMQDAGAV